jgi:hypothetical protein
VYLLKNVNSYIIDNVELVHQRYQIFCEVEGLERGPLSLVSTTEELLDRKVAAPV